MANCTCGERHEYKAIYLTINLVPSNNEMHAYFAGYFYHAASVRPNISDRMLLILAEHFSYIFSNEDMNPMSTSSFINYYDLDALLSFLRHLLTFALCHMRLWHALYMENTYSFFTMPHDYIWCPSLLKFKMLVYPWPPTHIDIYYIRERCFACCCFHLYLLSFVHAYHMVLYITSL